jgi:hypothetical protein
MTKRNHARGVILRHPTLFRGFIGFCAKQIPRFE